MIRKRLLPIPVSGESKGFVLPLPKRKNCRRGEDQQQDPSRPGPVLRYSTDIP